MSGTRVAVLGARGRMGATVCDAVNGADDLELVAALDLGDDISTVTSETCDVVVDFTQPDAVMGNLRSCIAAGVHCVVGTTGFTDDRLAELRSLLAEAPDVGVLIAPNFSVAAVLMMRFAEQAAPFFPSVEVVELHHDRKVDAPSGTATSTARRIAAVRAATGAGPVPDATTDERRRCPRRGRRRCARACGPVAWAGRPPGGAVRHRGRDADDPARLARPRLVHARRACWRCDRSPTGPV